jgi:transposase InsO family protein
VTTRSPKPKPRPRPRPYPAQDPAAALHEAILVWIEHTYNRRRRQRAHGALTPVQFELAFTQSADVAA